MIGSIAVPIGASNIKAFLNPKPKWIDPTAASPYPKPIVVNFLGVPSTDFTQADNWFESSAPPAPVVTTAVQYFSLSIPGLEMMDIPVEANGSDLRKNAIHYPGTALPGAYGNVVVYGHSALPQLYRPGNPLTIFNPLPGAKKGEEIIINFDGITYRYVVRDTKEVKPDEIEVLAQRYDRRELTVITCVPLGTYWRRFVVRAELVN